MHRLNFPVAACMLIICLSPLVSCTSINQSSKYQFVDGIYKAKIFEKNKKRIYVGVGEDTITVFRLNNTKKVFHVDTLRSLAIAFPVIQQDTLFNSYNFTQRSFDLDILTIPIKYRPSEAGLPNQLNTNFNGAFYTGYRRDVYRLSYRRAPFRVYKRKITHYGYSLGLFTGIGSTAINPWVTRDVVAAEYDGIVWLKGIAGIAGINNFTFGLALGVDHLLDKNHHVWIYQGKPWLGLTLGLNLN